MFEDAIFELCFDGPRQENFGPDMCLTLES